MHELFDERRYLIPFRSVLLPQIFTDTLVIGSGAAGLSSAIAAAGHGDVIVLAKGEAWTSNTSWAQGGVASVLAGDDTVDAHVADTLEAGAGLCDEPAVRRIAQAGPGAIERLLSWGMRLDRDGSGGLALGREGGHGARRIVHSDGDATGRELARVLVEKARSTEGVRLFEKCFALDLITPAWGGNGHHGGTEVGQPPSCLGAITWHPKHGLQVIWARSTVLAAGGSGTVWRESTNPPLATADGLAMAYRAGAELADLAFMQFHPTTLYVAGAGRPLISEAVRGEGATLLDESLTRFMTGYDERAELAPRDVVSRGIFDALSRQSLPHVWLDARGLEKFAERFPGIYRTLAKFDLDPSEDLIPVNPAAHYMVGGVRTDLEGRTRVPGLYAVGEVASTGLHGANRLASNSLLEAVVLGDAAGRAGEEMLGASPGDNAWGVMPRSGPVQVISDIPISDHGELDLGDVRSSVRSTMWRNVGVRRAGSRLVDVAEMFDFWARYTLDKIFDEPAGWEVQNMLLVGGLVARSALWRAESRGCHARDDAPEREDRFAVHDLQRRGVSGIGTSPVGAPAGVGA